MGRAPCCDKANVKKGPWSPEEDAKLKAYIEKYGTGGNWIALPQKIGLKRCGKSCRLRWLNYLRPNIKHGGFTEEEDNIICSLYISIGSRWSIIAAQLPGRTDNDIKNYWNTRLKKKLLGRRKHSSSKNRLQSIPCHDQPTKDAASEEDNSPYNLQNLSSSALERLQLHMHLQGLQNPSSFSFYNNNPSLWPKMIQTLHSQSQDQSTGLMYGQIPSTPHQPALIVHDHQNYSKKTDELETSVNGFTSSESSFPLNGDQHSNFFETDVMEQNGGIHQMSSGFTQAELDNLLGGNKSSSFLDCFKEMDGSNSRENQVWWSNEFDANSGSCDSATVLNPHQSGEMYQQDYYVQGYI